MLLAAHCALKFEISFRKYITSLDLKNKSISIAKGKTDLLTGNLIFKTSLISHTISEWKFKNQIIVQLACFTEAIQLLNKMHSV